MKQLKFNPDKDMKELEKYDYQLGENMLNVSYGNYGKIFKEQYDNILKVDNQSKNILFVIEIDKKGIVWLCITTKDSYRTLAYSDYEITKPYVDDLIKANLLIVESDEDVNITN